MQKIFGIGMSRTGTASLNVALKKLGFFSKHFPASVEEIADYDAATGISVCYWHKKLLKIYPESKLILTVRYPTDWVDSMKKIMDIEIDLKYTSKHRRILEEANFDLLGAVDFDRAGFLNGYKNHITNMMKLYGGRNNFLVLDICGGDGYEKLCHFLDLPLFLDDFPHITGKEAGGAEYCD
jgi:hypothetical protein